MKIAVASGKGGTGKTTVSVNLALSLGNVQLIDCDVEEPDCNVYLHANLENREEVYLPVPEIDKEKCTFCGKCSEFCNYNALAIFPTNALVFTDLCHGCGGCFILCPENALIEKKKLIGVIEHGTKSDIEFMRGVLNIGEAMATPVIRALKKKINNKNPVILDAPPGTACPVIETVSDCDFCLLVTEPTPFGLHDLTLAVQLTRVLNVPCGVVINKAGIGDDTVERYCQKEGIPVLMEIPHSREIAELSSQGIPFAEKMLSWKQRFHKLFTDIEGII
ncbi:MAG: (4Fe-4S)-binding protein [Theionarchaea archaeon DG-70-1]|nr:MAG: (4Fe-4S)-binding protein [Theionarchaea archaeon DG-70-1]